MESGDFTRLGMRAGYTHGEVGHGQRFLFTVDCECGQDWPLKATVAVVVSHDFVERLGTSYCEHGLQDSAVLDLVALVLKEFALETLISLDVDLSSAPELTVSSDEEKALLSKDPRKCTDAPGWEEPASHVADVFLSVFAGTSGQPMTVLVNGHIVSGVVCTAREWYTAISGGVDDEYSRKVSEALRERPTRNRFIHLRDVTVLGLNPGMSTIHHALPIRIRLDQVAGFVPGALSTRP